MNDPQRVTVDDVFELRKQQRTEDAYEAARRIYAVDKSTSATTAMFWTAIDMLRKLSKENHLEDARKIYKALERLMKGMDDKKGWMHNAMSNAQKLIDKEELQLQQENSPEHLQTGNWGEEMATAYLRDKGYVILDRNWHSGHRDIDIIAQQGNCIVFVEVKTRKNHEYIEPEQAVNYHKMRNLRLAINHYIHYRKLNNPWRFDVITVVGTINGTMPDINHIENFRIT